MRVIPCHFSLVPCPYNYPGDNFTAFPQQNVIGATGSSAVHDFDADVLLYEAGVVLDCGKFQHLSGAYQYQFGLQFQQRLHVLCAQLINMSGRPVIDQLFKRDNETGCFGAAIDQNRAVFISADIVPLVDFVFAEFHCPIIRQRGYAVECAALFNTIVEIPLEAAKVGLLGLGTVGGGTATVLLRNADEIKRRVGRSIEITHAAGLGIADQTLLDSSKVKLTEDAFEVVNDPDVDIIVELIGGYTLAKDLVMKAIENGKHVVTANKALIATHGAQIMQAAMAKGVNVAYEAAVAGGIPIIKAVREGLAANRINWIAGIINGTGNFILTEMRDKGRDFDDVLKEAQALGYAEADPTFDVEGIDAAHKLTILASLAFGIELQFDKCYTEGISKITTEDVQYASELGYRIKHLGIARKTADGIELRVHPTLIPEKRLIANVNGVMNAVLVQGDAVGPTLYYGAGAGAEPTASAVVADIIDTVRTIDIDADHKVPLLGFKPDAMSDIAIMPIEDIETACYLRMTALDKPGVLAEVSEVFAQHKISLEAVLQKEPAEGADKVHLVLLTQKVKESNINAAIAEVESFSEIEGSVARIRLEHLG